MSWSETLAVVLFVVPMVVVVFGGTIFGALELLSPSWYLYLKERRRHRRKAVKRAVEDELKTPGRRSGNVEW